ncbi:MAG TPA: cupin domain-containing protein [Candidatus Udaeobacter sp.]|nr:cupin domain-containing protein [Candidatus Udaeobacter sp.]
MRTMFGSALATLLAMALPLMQSPAEGTQAVDMRLYPPTTIEWKTGPAGLPPGARMAVLEGDPTKEGPFVVRFRFPDGYHIAPHTHPKTERVTVISGALYLATGEALDRESAKKLPAGSFGYWPAGMKHTAWSEGETVIQLHGVGPWQINYVNPADDPRNAKK